MNAEVYDAETVDALKALELSMHLATTTLKGRVSEIMIFLDNSSVIDGILGKTPDSSQGECMKLRRIALELLLGIKTKVAWVPGHKNVLGNEKADKLAKEGSELLEYTQNYSTTTLVQALQPLRRNIPTGTETPKAYLHLLLAKRTGHGGFQEYHERFGHDARPKCKRGEPRKQWHFVECRMVKPFLPEIPEKDLLEGETHLTYLLGPKVYKEHQKLPEETNPYSPATRPTQ
ncbi:endonuclease exonuclease phosphatase [Trichoderma arundinaceum]|uniref:Endonuclease exonuclease phosphatase n=1 Tax=Trichoderma arundinaceum TaxID=490622 RepID=A0A395NDR7_TRIAR|nr:endonuclease exonuclease phosphatase [Trichoderma arundinaceum]